MPSVVEAALRNAGFQTQRRDQTADLADAFPGMGEGLAEWIVTAADGEQVMLQMAYFDRGCRVGGANSCSLLATTRDGQPGSSQVEGLSSATQHRQATCR